MLKTLIKEALCIQRTLLKTVSTITGLRVSNRLLDRDHKAGGGGGASRTSLFIARIHKLSVYKASVSHFTIALRMTRPSSRKLHTNH